MKNRLYDHTHLSAMLMKKYSLTITARVGVDVLIGNFRIVGEEIS